MAAFVEGKDGRWLFIRRAKEPGKGKLAPPGGFVDIGETGENAAQREIREELGVELSDFAICLFATEHLRVPRG